MASTSEQSNIALVQALFSAFGRPAEMRSALETYLSEDCQYGEWLKDRDSILRWLFGTEYKSSKTDTFWPDGLVTSGGNAYETAFVRIVAELKRVTASEDLVFVERVDHHYDAEGHDALISPLVAVMEIRDGKIAKWRDYLAADQKER